MNAKNENKVLEPNQCPRCGGYHTEFADRDGSVETWICRDCEAKDPDGDGGYYDLLYLSVLGSVQWYTNDYTVAHESHDSDYLAMLVAGRLRDELAWIVEFIEEHPEWDQEYFRKGGAAHAESDWFDRAQALLAEAKGDKEP